MENSLWSIVQDEYNSDDNKKYETIFTLANGYRGLRGKLELSVIGERGNFIAGVFDKSEAQVIQIVNGTDPLCFNIYIDGKLLDMDRSEIVDFKRCLNLREGMLNTQVILKMRDGKLTEIVSERFVSKKNVHRWGASYKIKPMNYTGIVTVENIIDGTTTNSTDFPSEMVKHYKTQKVFDNKPGVGITTVTNDRKIEIEELTTLRFFNSHGEILHTQQRKYGAFGEKSREIYSFTVEEKEEYIINRYGVTYTSRDTNDCLQDVADKELMSYLQLGYNAERELHIEEWKHLWDMVDIVIEGDDEAQRGMRFNIFQLSSSAYAGDGRISIAAKGLHGEGYKGHVFWDTEIFMLPFFVYSQPEVARQLLSYRYNTIEGAKTNARLNGYSGAQFPWESADDGAEVTPKWGRDYDGNAVRIWTGDEEFHINSDITFGIWEYYRATGDVEFLIKYGLEIFIETAKFWSTRLEYNNEKDRYEINSVIGPDEFHEHVNNNVYTNYLAKWSLKKSIELCAWYKENDRVSSEKLFNRLDVNDTVIRTWDSLQQKVFIPVNKENNIIEQFEGYFELPMVPITEHDSNNMPIWPVLNGLKLHETQLVKQADVVMLMLLLGDEFDLDTKKKNYHFYEERTMHKSSLSPSMYSIMGLGVGDTHNAYGYFMKTLFTDLEDNQGNAEYGVHAAATGGAWQSAIFGFGGFSVDHEGIPNFNPWIPEHWKKLDYKIKWKTSTIHIVIEQKQVKLTCNESTTVKVFDKQFCIDENKEQLVSF